MQAVNQQKPISPQNLLQILLITSFKEQECEDQGQRIKQQKQILKSLIQEYKKQLEIKTKYFRQIQTFIQIRAKLRLDLQRLRDQRRSFDVLMAEQVMKLKLTPIQIRQNAQTMSQLDQLRDQNNKMNVRLHQLQDYTLKMERKILILQKQNNIIQVQQVNRRKVYQTIDSRLGELNWRDKIQILKKQQQVYSKQLRNHLKERQQRALEQLQAQYAANILQKKLNIREYDDLWRLPSRRR